MESKNIEECNYLENYNLGSFIFIVVSNFYLISQMCNDRPRLFMNNLDEHFIIQVLLYSILCILLVLGIIFIKDYENCRLEEKNIFYLSLTNIIIEFVIWIVINIFIIYYCLYSIKIQPETYEMEEII